MRATRPLFRFDPGWLFVMTGLAVCAAGVLLPAQADLRALEEQLVQLHGEEARAYQRLAAHAEFIDQVDRSDPAMIRRLAAAQLNLVPEGDKPVLLAGSNGAPVTEWIDNTLDTDIRPPDLEPVSTLSRWASGPSRLWMFGGGMMAVFIGLLISPSREASHRGTRRVAANGGASIARSSQFNMAWSAINDDDIASDDNRNAAYRDSGAVMQSLPETVDVDDLADLVALEQQEDTVDLEEDELPARIRTIIDDDEAWHQAATIEHADEVVVSADAIEPSYEQTLLWGECRDSVRPALDEFSGSESLQCADAQSTTQNCVDTGTPWLFDDRAGLGESSLLLSENDEQTPIEVDAAVPSDTSLSDRPDAATMEADSAGGGSAITLPGEQPQIAGRAPDPRVSVAASSSEREDRRDAPARKKRQAKRIVERKPKPKPGARRPPSADQGDSAAIPFLRYREHVDDDLDGDHEGPKVEITSGEESMPSMALEGDASTDLADSDMSENHDAGPDGDSLRFRDA